MTPTDDELFARLRASFQATAARTPIGAGRLDELTTPPVGKRSNAFVISLSAAAAVAVIGGVTAVAASVGSGSSGAPTLGIGGSPSPGVTPTAGAPGPTCVPENYGVIASADEVAQLSYILPAVPAGYQLYGAWGVIDRHKCAGTTSWYVEYDDANGFGNTDNKAIQLRVTTATAVGGVGQALRQELELPSLGPQLVPTPPSGSLAASSTATATPTTAAASTAPGTSPGPALGSGWTQVKVGAGVGQFADHKAGFGMLLWTNDGLIFQLNAPDPGGDAASLAQLAQSLVHVSPTDPRIKPPADCQVPAGQTCSG